MNATIEHQELIPLHNTALTIKNETIANANSANRVGGVILGIIEYIDDINTSGSGEGGAIVGPSGPTGGHYEFRYKNYTPTELNPLPAKPEDNTDGTTNGWTRTPSSPNVANGEYTYQSSCYVTVTRVNGNDVESYGIWTTPFRITGENGKDGEDGKSLEYIYLRYNSDSLPSNLTAITPLNWLNNTNYLTDDYVPPISWTDNVSNITYSWTDNPLGVSLTVLYEFVTFRWKIDGVWQPFGKTPNSNNILPPAIWSKWGEKGMDGDGFEYIFKRFTNTLNFGLDNNNPAYWPANLNDEYYGPTGYEWMDDPLNLDSTNRYQYVSTRKKTNGMWGLFRTPKLWNFIDSNSIPGSEPQVINGQDGEDGEFWLLEPVKELALVTLGTNLSNNIVGTLGVDLQYAVVHIQGAQKTYISIKSNSNDSDTYHIKMKSDIASSWTDFYTTGAEGDPVSISTVDEHDVIRYNNPSYIQNYHNAVSKPKYFDVCLMNGNTEVSKRVVNVVLESGAALSVTDSINTVVQGHSTDIGTLTNGVSSLTQNYNSIQATVQSITTGTVVGFDTNLIMNGAFRNDNIFWENWSVLPSGDAVGIPSNLSTKQLRIATKTAYMGYKQNHYGDFGIMVLGDTKYTLSFKAKRNNNVLGSNGMIGAIFHWYDDSNTVLQLQTRIEFAYDDLTTSFIQYKQTFTTPVGAHHFTIMIGNLNNVESNDRIDFSITEIKLLVGSVATAWTAAPEEKDYRISRIELTADRISLGVERSYYNYAVNFLAVDLEILNNISHTVSNDLAFGSNSILNFSLYNSKSGYCTLSALRAGYDNLTNVNVTYFCVVKENTASSNNTITFGAGSNFADALIINSDGNGEIEPTCSIDSTYVNYDEYINGKINLGNGWYTYYTTFTDVRTSIAKYISDSEAYCGLRNIRGDWSVYAVGIVEGNSVMNIVDIQMMAGALRTGIDITDGKIRLQADKVVFTDSTGTIDNKVSIDSTTGTLIANDAVLTGNVTANSGTIGPLLIGDILGTNNSILGKTLVGEGMLLLSENEAIARNLSHILKVEGTSYMRGIQFSVGYDIYTDVQYNNDHKYQNLLRSLILVDDNNNNGVVTLPNWPPDGFVFIFIPLTNNFTISVPQNTLLVESDGTINSSLTRGRHPTICIKATISNNGSNSPAWFILNCG